ncbi:CDP-diacylglycerol diphosphatase [Burkholderia arboris]|uniref:CDP-diacylglycerol pyrophosphatase n=1 Tax=Burkholderia metallica TaxID=488729 RepID=A0ABT8P8M2_9BURK|nr:MULTISPECIES: CDP-diacylglycerol diphosphatase [Burkholderia cepacia complex]MCA8035395.1 CDP-diacylglycerol diphosphatase [Burkholderia arboris]MDN7931454.1 CDP-diacylglycerol diphosphatase [Burkholderia metallica]
MGKKIKLTVFLAFILVLMFSIYYLFGRGNVNALWEIVDQQCVPNQQEHGLPAPCRKVDLAKKYVLFKDAKGPLHDLVMPTYRLTGIESPELQHEDAPSFFAYAWSERGSLAEELGRPIADSHISLAVNSKYGRSQDLLHIHTACLEPYIYRLLEAEQSSIGPEWQPLGAEIKGHLYFAKRLEGTDLVRENPFKVLNAHAASQGDDIAKFGLALVVLKDGGMALLANRFDLMGLNFGSAGEIQDYSCSIAADAITAG